MLKFICLPLFFIVLFSNFSFAQKKKEIKVYFDQGQFYTPETGNYLEVQLNFMGHSLNYIDKGSEIIAEVEMAQLISQNDSTIIHDKYVLNSPIMIDSTVENFFDIQRYPLLPGDYDYFLSIKDKNSKNKPLTLHQRITVEDFSKGITFSSFVAAELIIPNPENQSDFTKIGYDVVPMFGNYYPVEVQNLLYYLEIYNSDKALDDSVYVVAQKIKNQRSGDVIDDYTRYFRYRTLPIQPVSKVVDISLLPAGSYILELEVLNREKTVLTKSMFEFERNNLDEINEINYETTILNPEFEKSVSEDSLRYYVASLIPIANQAEVKNIIKLLKEKDNGKNYRYLQAFWTNVNPKNPYESWIKYKAQVQMVERLYSTNLRTGFDTDRGRVYLAYGSPSSVIEEPSSPSEYPYEVWRYDKIKQFSNRRFIFYNTTNLNKDYRLLHSDMLGEIQNYRWQYELNKRNTPNTDLDNPTGGAMPHFGGNSSRYFNSY